MREIKKLFKLFCGVFISGFFDLIQKNHQK
jgi:hypothetical protein